mgnify:CR=1 FL=1
MTVEGHPARQVARDLDIHESLLRRQGWPPMFAGVLAIPVVRVPSERGYLLVLGWKRYGRRPANSVWRRCETPPSTDAI